MDEKHKQAKAEAVKIYTAMGFDDKELEKKDILTLPCDVGQTAVINFKPNTKDPLGAVLGTMYMFVEGDQDDDPKHFDKVLKQAVFERGKLMTTHGLTAEVKRTPAPQHAPQSTQAQAPAQASPAPQPAPQQAPVPAPVRPTPTPVPASPQRPVPAPTQPVPVRPSPTRPTNSILGRIRSVSEQNINLSVALYGRSGTGKTFVSSSFPKPMLIIDIREHGTIGLKEVEGIDVLDISKWREMEKAIDELKREPHGYQTITIDTLTGLQDLATLEVIEANHMKITDKVSLPMHGTIGTMMCSAITDLATIAPNVLFLCQDKKSAIDEEAASDQNIPEVGPELKDKVAKHLTRTVSVVAQTFIKDEKDHDAAGKVIMVPTYRLRLGPNGTYATKIRQPVGSNPPADIDITIRPGKNEPSAYEKLVAIITPHRER